jgi:hypothetical protein
MTLSSTSTGPASRVIANDHGKAKPADRRKASTEAGVKHQPKFCTDAWPLLGST